MESYFRIKSEETRVKANNDARPVGRADRTSFCQWYERKTSQTRNPFAEITIFVQFFEILH